MCGEEAEVGERKSDRSSLQFTRVNVNRCGTCAKTSMFSKVIRKL